jgi:hypothetical protein
MRRIRLLVANEKASAIGFWSLTKKPPRSVPIAEAFEFMNWTESANKVWESPDGQKDQSSQDFSKLN